MLGEIEVVVVEVVMEDSGCSISSSTLIIVVAVVL